ncbi:hypothetical protein Tco_0648846 [Tanacetum coccineum]
MFDSSSKNSSDDELQPSSNAEKKDDESVSKASGFSDQEKPESSTPNINIVGPSINTASTKFKTGSLNINTVSPTVITTRLNRSQNESNMFSLRRSATLEATHADLFGDEIEMGMSNLTISYQGPTTPNTRIYKDHLLDHVIGDIQSGVQTRGMLKNNNQQPNKRQNTGRAYAAGNDDRRPYGGPRPLCSKCNLTPRWSSAPKATSATDTDIQLGHFKKIAQNLNNNNNRGNQVGNDQYSGQRCMSWAMHGLDDGVAALF